MERCKGRDIRIFRLSVALNLLFLIYLVGLYYISTPSLSGYLPQWSSLLPSIKVPHPESSERGKANKNRKLFPCDDFTPRRYYAQRGNYGVLYNYIKASKTFRCDESVTYTTHTDWRFLDNLVPLLERWSGPISLALYSPGTDFEDTLQRIQFLRHCGDSATLVTELVTFHIFFNENNFPNVNITQKPEVLPVNCGGLTDNYKVTFSNENVQTYKTAKKLTYPVNVARNVAREMATTHYVLPSDIELYPNPNFVTDFLEMIRVNDTVLQRPAPRVFVLSVFELEANVTSLPYDKRDIIQMLQNHSAIPFHKHVCPKCHGIPKAKEWEKAPIQPELKVFHIGKRHAPFHHWEPFFVGTKFDPMYDERLSWEGLGDKMTQAYIMCIKDYEFHILNNAFLVHHPGIKKGRRLFPKEVEKQKSLINNKIKDEVHRIYGTNLKCAI